MTAAQAELRVSVVRDHDDECSVVATIRSGDFSGSGRAWLHIADVSDFAKAVKALAGSSAGEAKLFGGYLKKHGSPDPTVNVRLVPHGPRGHISIAADLWSGPSGTTGVTAPVSESRMSTAIVVEPAALERFADRLLNIAKGAEVESVVHGEASSDART